MLYTSLRIVPPAEKREEALRILRSLLGPTRVARGCISCRFYEDGEDPNALSYVEEWQTEQDLERHIRSGDYRKVLAVMDLACEPPELKFYKASETFGIEYVARLLSPKGQGEGTIAMQEHRPKPNGPLAGTDTSS